MLQEINQLATLPFGVGKVGKDRHLAGEQNVAFRAGLARHMHLLPTGHWVTGDCMDERKTLRLADGTDDAEILKNRIAAQFAGGTVLATLKAGMAANIAMLRDAKNMQDGYVMLSDTFRELGIPDGAHEGCGASKYVLASVEKPVANDKLLKTFAALGTSGEMVAPLLNQLASNKNRLLDAGFYDSWDPAWHANYVSTRQPENFSYLDVRDDEFGGHYANGLAVVPDGYYFAKNAFIEDTGYSAFALTFGVADKLADALGGSDSERQLMKIAYREDAFNVSNHIVAEGLEVYV